MLAEHLCEDGDYDRAYRYVCFGRDCNLAFTPTLRHYQVNSTINVIEKSKQEGLAHNRHLLIYAAVVTVLLLIVLLVILFRLRQHPIKK